MPYTNIDFGGIRDAELQRTFRHADMVLSDVYSMFLFDAPKESNGGGGNFSIALVLMCVIDGMASAVVPWPPSKDHGERLVDAIKRYLPWQDGWADKGQAAQVLYVEVRNSITHELGADIVSGVRHPGWDEPSVHKWGQKWRLSADELDALEEWPNKWPILAKGRNAAGQPRYELSTAALYWAVKRMVSVLVRCPKLSELAEAARAAKAG